MSLPIPEHINWFVFRPVLEKVASLQEIDCHYDINDLESVHEALDLQHEATRMSHKMATKS